MDMLNLIPTTLARASALGGNLQAPIFARLYAMNPAYEAMFCMDSDGGVRASMLTTCVNCVLGVAAGNVQTPAYLIEAARMIHDGYGIREEDVDLMFVAMRDTYRNVLGEEWTGEIEREWEALLSVLAGMK
jgi:hemoglobin-like flavoprotein